MNENLDSRLTFSLSQNDHNQLKYLALGKRVSLGWVIREAIRQYIDREKESDREKVGNNEQSLF
jgi:predicted transcriptional regulator